MCDPCDTSHLRMDWEVTLKQDDIPVNVCDYERMIEQFAHTGSCPLPGWHNPCEPTVCDPCDPTPSPPIDPPGDDCDDRDGGGMGGRHGGRGGGYESDDSGYESD